MMNTRLLTYSRDKPLIDALGLTINEGVSYLPVFGIHNKYPTYVRTP